MRKFLQLTLSLLLLFVANSANAWKFTVNSPAEGNVEELYQIVLDEPAGTMWIDETGAMPCTLKCSDGTEYTYLMSDNFSAQVAGTPQNSAEIVAPGTYTMTIPAGTFHISGTGNEEQTFTWTIGGAGNEEEKSPYTLTYDKAGELLKLTKEGCTSYEATYAGGATLEGFDGWFSFNPIDPEWTMMGNTCIGAYVALADGDYTLKVQAGTYKFDGVENEAFEIKFTVGEGGDNGGGNTGDFDGEKWQEVLFEAGVTSVSIPYTAETEGLSIKTEGREFMGTTIDVAYNTYDENELDWNNGTKFIITAKDNISGIVFEGQYINFASADKGTYINGVWSGALMKGETLTLTANDGILVKKITVLYNGDELKSEEEEEEEGKITVAWPVQDQVIASIAQSGLLTKFTTNKDYAMVTIALENDNKFYAPHDLQVRMYDGQVIGEGVAKDIEHVVTTAVPNEKSFQLFKGDTYTLTLKGFINPWDVPDNYDAITVVKIIGDGIEHEPTSAVKLVSMTPEGTPLEPGELPIKDGKITLTFDGAVTSVTAVNARGMEGSTTYKGTQADEEGKVWTVALGDLSSLASSETQSIIFNLNITAQAADGAVVFDETKYDYRLEAAWTLIEVLEMVTTTSLMLGEDEVAVNDHSAVSVENADAIKVQVENAPLAIGFTYAVNAMVLDEDEFGQFWKEGAELAVGEGNFNGGTGYAQFEAGTINFEEGNKYQVKVTVYGGDPTADPAELGVYTYEINGAYVAPMTVTSSLMLGEDEVAINDHDAVSVENADGIKVQVENEPSVIGFSYNINIMKAVEGEESTAWVADESYDIAVGEGNFNGGTGYAQFEAGTINFEEGNKYQVKVTVYGGDPTADPAELATYTYEINGAYVAPIEITAALVNGEEEIALFNGRDASAEMAEAIKVDFENGAAVLAAAYVISEVAYDEENEPYNDEIAYGELSINGNGYAEFEDVIKFEQGKQYQVDIVAYGMTEPTEGDGNFSAPTPIATFTCTVNGAYVEPMIVTTSLMLGEDEVAINDHSAVSVESADAIKVQVENEPSVIGFSYNINVMKAVEGEEGTAWVADESYDIAVGEGNFNGGTGYAQFENGTISFAEGNKYQVKVTVYGGNPADPSELGVCTYEINGSAEVADATMVITDAKYATFYAPFAVEIPEGVNAYTVPTLDADGTTLTMAKIKDSIIPAYTPVVVYGEEANEYYFDGTVELNKNASEGLLTGVLEATAAPVGSYVLQNHGADKVGFFQVEDGVKVEVAANRAYLTAPASDVKAFYLNDATAIKALESLMAGKAQIFDLNGRQQSKLQKGINIVNGVKVLVK